MEEILKINLRIVLVDLRGFGDSSYNNKLTSVEELSLDLADFCEKLSLKSIHICGWSLGAVVSLLLASQYPNLIQKCILVAGAHIEGYKLYRSAENGEISNDHILDL